MVKIRFFGSFKEKFGEFIEINIVEISLKNILLILEDKHLKKGLIEDLNKRKAFVAVNHKIINDFNVKIKNEDLIAIFPIVSGG